MSEERPKPHLHVQGAERAVQANIENRGTVNIFRAGHAGDATPAAGVPQGTDWRPAEGLSVPHAEKWRLVRKIGEGGFGTVWLAVDKITGANCVVKFCVEQSRARALKNEIATVRLLQRTAGGRPDILPITEWHLEHPPYFIASPYAELGSLDAWAGTRGGLGKIPLEERIEIVALVAEALAAVHTVGVIHCDVKPGNIMMLKGAGRAFPAITDFGLAGLLDPELFKQHDITVLSAEDGSSKGSAATGGGSHRYRDPTVGGPSKADERADLYSLGVVLYQMVCADFRASLAPGWEETVEDPILREWITLSTHQDRARRLAGPAALADNLRRLDQVRRERGVDVQLLAAAKARVARLKRRWLVSIGAGAGLSVLTGGAVWLAVQARVSAKEATIQRQIAERETARALSFEEFLRDVASKSQVGTGEADRSIAQVLLEMSANLNDRFPDNPALVVSMRSTIGSFLWQSGRFRAAEEEYSSGLALARERLDEADPACLLAMANYGFVLEQRERYLEAEPVLRDALRLSDTKLGPANLVTARTAVYLAGLLWKVERSEEGLALVVHYRDEFVRAGRNDFDLLCLLEQMEGVLRLTLGNAQDAESLLRQAFNKRRERQGLSNMQTLACGSQLALCLVKLGQIAEADELTDTLYDAADGRFPPSHMVCMATSLLRGQEFFRRGQYAEAVEVMSRTAEAMAADPDAVRYRHARLKSEIGMVLTQMPMSQFDEAEEELLEAQAILESVLDGRSRFIKENRARLHDLYVRWMRPEEAARWAP